MDFLSKCDVLGDLWLYYREQAKSNAWKEFFEYSDIALPASYLISQEYVVANQDSDLVAFVDESWSIFCEMISIDPDGNYPGLAAAWEASPNSWENEVEEIKEEITVEEKPVRKRSTKKAAPPPE